MTTATYQQKHLESLTGLRFLAALSVFVAHIGVHWPMYRLGDLPLGAAGVSFFYVLSGFILTYVYGSRQKFVSHETKSSEPFSFRQFYLRRFARIWPLHFVTLLLSLFVVLGVRSFFNHPNPIGKLILNAFMLQSWVPNEKWTYSLNGPSWSLAVEAFFYAIFPFLFLGGSKRFVAKYILIVVGTIVALLLINQFAPRADSWIQLNFILQTNPLMRLFEFATGVGCGFLFLNRTLAKQESQPTRQGSAIEFAVVALLIVFFVIANSLGMYSVEFGRKWPIVLAYWFRFCGAAPVFALVIYTFARTNGLLTSVLSSRLMVYLGEISFSFYMVHMGVMLILTRIDWLDGRWVNFGTVVCCFCFSLFLSSALFHLVEVPCRIVIRNWAAGKGLSSAPTALIGSVGGWVRMVWFGPLLLLAIASLWFVNSNRFDVHDQSRIDMIVAASVDVLKGVEFEEDAILLGVKTEQAEGQLTLEMVWNLKSGRRSERFVKLLDSGGKVIGRGNANRDLFGVVEGDEVVIDRIKIPAEKLTGVAVIAVGFFDKDRKAAVVDRGPRSGRNRQLHVWSK